MRPAQHPQPQLESTHARGGVRSLIGRSRRLMLAAAGLLFVLLAAVATWAVFAATVTWTGQPAQGCGTGLWSVAACWNNGAGPVPSNGDDVVVAGGQQRFQKCDISRTLNSITFNPGAPQSNTVDAGGCSLGLQSGAFITDNANNNNATQFSVGITLNGPATFTLGSPNNDTLAFNGSLTGTGGLTLVNNAANDALVLGAVNIYIGGTIVNGTGRVRFGVDGAVPASSALTVNSSAFFQTSSTIGSIAGGGNVFMNGSNPLTAGGDTTSTTFSGVYQNSGGAAALTKAGAGTLTLSGANTYTGATTVNAGTLAVTGSIVSPVTVNSGGTLGGTGTISNTA